jgi:hypothetical protein
MNHLKRKKNLKRGIDLHRLRLQGIQRNVTDHPLVIKVDLQLRRDTDHLAPRDDLLLGETIDHLHDLNTIVDMTRDIDHLLVEDQILVKDQVLATDLVKVQILTIIEDQILAIIEDQTLATDIKVVDIDHHLLTKKEKVENIVDHPILKDSSSSKFNNLYI